MFIIKLKLNCKIIIRILILYFIDAVPLILRHASDFLCFFKKNYFEKISKIKRITAIKIEFTVYVK